MRASPSLSLQPGLPSLLQPSTLMASLWPPPRVPQFVLPLLQAWLSGTDASPTLLPCAAAPLSALTQDLYVLNICDILLSPLTRYPKSAFLRLRIFPFTAPPWTEFSQKKDLAQYNLDPQSLASEEKQLIVNL